MATLSDESKMIIASNLTVAALLQELMMSQRIGKPVVETEDVIFGTFQRILNRLDREER
ncbi:MAG: hypothetical protein JXD19_05055 [Deltaproteobacteria bacterium]|nr:hypothetical protein [Deltaproteobacteria bacterium]